MVLFKANNKNNMKKYIIIEPRPEQNKIVERFELKSDINKR